MNLIDSRDGVEKVSAQIASSAMVLTESMHGAIVAQAYEVPWIPFVSRREILDFKWKDWCASIGVDYKPVYVSPMVEDYNSYVKFYLKNIIKYPKTKSDIKAALSTKPTFGLAKDVRKK